jgi:hypothetical protein
MRVASIALGIIAYPDPRLASSQARLHFSTDDALAFHRYVMTAWSGDRNLHLCLLDLEADRIGLEQAIGTVAAAGPLDLVLLYLSGHGEVHAHEGWFCLADAASGEPSLTSSEIDRLLLTIDTRQVLVIADYCYSEASLAGSRFFAALEGRSARIYIASARSSQQAWEDTELKRSILSDVLLKAMASGSPLAERDGTVDVETRLIPHLREQVPLEAAVRKRGTVQEPVTGGSASGSIWLPTVAARDMRRNLSISDTLRMRLRRILAVSAIAVLAAWTIADILVYHLALGPNGTILVRPGLAALYGLTLYHIGNEVDTGFAVQDFSARDQDAFRRLSRGSEFGFTTRKDHDGLALWLAQLEPALTSSSAARARMLARADTPQMESDDPPPVWEAAFVAYASATEPRTIADRIYPAPSPVEVDCGRPVAMQLDFTLLDVPPDVFARDLVWRALRIEDARHQGEIIQLVTAVVYRSANAKQAAQIGRDTEALAAAAALLKSRSWPQLPNLNGWCEGAPAALMRALIGDDRTRAGAEAALVAGLPSAPSPPGEDLPHRQMTAVAALTALVSRGPLQNRTVEGIVASFDRSGERLGLDTPLNRLLFETAAHQLLPQNFRARIFALLGQEEGAVDFEAIEGFRLLARNSNHLTSAELSALRTWLNREGEAHRTLSNLHEGLGYLALVVPLRPDEKAWLVARLSPDSWLPPQAVSYRGETIFSASDGEAAVALARLNQRQSLEREVIERLLTIASHRTDLQERPAMLRGLGFAKARFDREIVEGLSSQKTSVVVRRLYIDIAVEQLRVMRPGERARILSNLFQRWQRSRAPELRLALGEIIGRVMAEPL